MSIEKDEKTSRMGRFWEDTTQFVLRVSKRKATLLTRKLTEDIICIRRRL